MPLTFDALYHNLRYMSTSQNEILYNIFMRLKELREERKLKQIDVANYLNVKQNTYSQYESEKRQLPIDVLIKLARFYDVRTDYILELED